MAYNNNVMPQLKLVHGVQKTIIDPVTITGNGNREVRRKQNRHQRFMWKFPSRSILQQTKQDLYNFFQYQSGAHLSFAFQDPDFPEFNKHRLPYFPGVYSLSDTNHPYYDFWMYTLPGYEQHPLFVNPYMYDLNVSYVNASTGAEIDMGTGWCDQIILHPEYHVTMIHIPGSWAIASQEVGTVWTPQITGPCFLVGRLNNPITWSISAMAPSAIGSSCSPTPTIVDMGDIEIIEVFEGL